MDSDIRVEDAIITHTEHVVDEILDIARGYDLLQDLTAAVGFAIVAALTLVAVTVYLGISGTSPEILIGSAALTAYVLFETVRLVHDR